MPGFGSKIRKNNNNSHSHHSPEALLGLPKWFVPGG